MENFNTEKDLMFLKTHENGESPFEYLYIHLEDAEGANFMAYFDGISRNEPEVYPMEQVTIEELKAHPSNIDDLARKILAEKSDSSRCWQRIVKPNMFTAGIWEINLKLIREEIFNSKNKKQ